MMPIAEGYHYGFAGPVGAHPIARDLPTATRVESGGGVLATPLQNGNVLEFQDSRTYTLTIHHADALTNAALQAPGDERPYVRVVTNDGMAADAANLRPDVGVTGQTRTFRVEGVWLASSDETKPDFVVERASPAGAGLDWDEIVLRGATFDPGGLRGDGTPITALRLRIIGRVRRLVIERCIVGPILVEQFEDCSESGFVEELVITDSIVDASQIEPHVGIDCTTGRVTLRGVTVLGDVRATVLDASDTIVTGRVFVLNQQESCFRFSAASPGGALPRLFESSTLVEIVPAFFTSQRFGDPGYCALSVVAPPEIARGAENGSEMGAFSFLLRPIRLRSITAKVGEFKPAGVIDQYVFEGEHAPEAVPTAED